MRTLSGGLLTFLLLATPLAQQARPLDVLAPLIGGEWVTEFPGDQVTDTQRFEWTLNQQFVRNIHQVRANGQIVYSGETIYAWDTRGGRIVWWYWNTTGGYLTGTVTVNPDGSFLSEGENHGSKDQLDRSRSRIRISKDGWTSEGSLEKDGKWTDQPPRTYRRPKT